MHFSKGLIFILEEKKEKKRKEKKLKRFFRGVSVLMARLTQNANFRISYFPDRFFKAL